MYGTGVGGGGEYNNVTAWSTPIPVGAFGCGSEGVISGVRTSTGVPLRVTIWSVISGELISGGLSPRTVKYDGVEQIRVFWRIPSFISEAVRGPWLL